MADEFQKLLTFEFSTESIWKIPLTTLIEFEDKNKKNKKAFVEVKERIWKKLQKSKREVAISSRERNTNQGSGLCHFYICYELFQF